MTAPTETARGGTGPWGTPRRAVLIAIVAALAIVALVVVIAQSGGGSGATHSVPNGGVHMGAPHPHPGR